MGHSNIDNWLDYLIKRWPVALALVALIVGVSKTQWVQNAQADEIREIKESIKSFRSVQAEWPYLKQRVEDVNKKQDEMAKKQEQMAAQQNRIDSKLDLLLERRGR